MSAVQDEQLFNYADRVKGKVVVITGAANGIGKETALRFASYGAKVVIGDLDSVGAQKVVTQIQQSKGTASSIPCDVTKWDDQVALFELAFRTYGSVDVVVPNAGITEVGGFRKLQFKDGNPVPPNLKTLDVNLIGVLYTANLSMHYLQLNKEKGDLKSLIFVGSMASWLSIPLGEMYTASKHAILGVMRSIHPILEMQGIRVGCIHPFFADTGIVPIPVKLLLAGIPLTPISRVAGAIFYAATDPDRQTNGSAWVLTDDGPVFMVPREEFKLGVYQMIDERRNAGRAIARGVVAWLHFFRDIGQIIQKPLSTLIFLAALGFLWKKGSFAF